MLGLLVRLEPRLLVRLASDLLRTSEPKEEPKEEDLKGEPIEEPKEAPPCWLVSLE